MIKFLIKLALSALIASATWQIGSAYAADYRLKDAAEAAALKPRITDEELRARILELASENGAALDDEHLEIRREVNRLYIEASYIRPVDVLPGYERQWPFGWSVEVIVTTPPQRHPK